MRGMKGARALLGGLLLLAAACLAPAVSAAQDPGAAATTTTSVLPTPTTTTDAPAAEAGTGTPGQATSQPVTADPTVSAGPPASTTSGGASAFKSASASVTMGDFFFQASSVTIAVGDTVTWTNSGQAPHNATADDGSFKTPTLNNGQSASHTFNQPGTFSYICTIHPNMHGTIRVLAASSGGSGSKGSGSSSGSNGTAGSSSSGSAPSEAQAVASPNAAGSSSSLPATGMATGALALIGVVLLASGLITRRAERHF
jgi:LPXTG-motif cell wall-anchored protein